ncbi:helix-turn-helix transcriptional regulator [Micromonospora sp. NPDC005367]|uniref:PadR family transcriptional regulator n=1 Tax=Micromonospora sp. NPDC005367 TaxID=3155590 RepID=UPI0033A86E91
MRLTTETLQVLGALLDDPHDDHFGLEIAEAAGLPPGGIYPVLARLEAAGWVESGWSERDPRTQRRRRFYRITSDGTVHAHKALREAASRSASRWGGILRPGSATA